jgi:hypothetical protein
MFSRYSRIPIEFDEAALKEAGVAPGTKIPLKLAGGLSLRSWLELVLDPLGLEAKPGDDGLVIVKATNDPARREPSDVQKQSNRRIEEKLSGKASFDFKDATLESVAQHFEGQTGENFVLDPAARMANRIDPEAKVSGSAKDVPLGEALDELLKPLGLKSVVRDEVVLITK